MPWSLTPERHYDPELMDAPGLPESELVDAYRVLRRVNSQLGNLWTARREASRLLDEDGPWTEAPAVSLLDVGSGSGDVPRAIRDSFKARLFRTTVCALDRDPTAVSLARRSKLDVVRADSLRLPFATASFDLVMAVKFAHHFEGETLLQLLAEMTRVARRRVIILDIRRHWLAYYGFIVWSRIFTRNRLAWHDGPISVLRGFTADELRALGETVAGFRWTVRAYVGFQLALVGRRIDQGG
jgi:ubiquinone/menaquinone biosynthesis C-methylase UbiE